jgi:serine/threonine-protein kinase HipA
MLDVYLHNRRAGALERKQNGNLQFRYDEAYEGPPLSLKMLLRPETYGHRECLAFFGNLLPEENVRAQVALSVGISSSNDYRLLERFGGDMAGAVTLVPPGSDPETGAGEPESLTEAKLDELLVNLPQRPLAADEDDEIRLSLAGAQSKLPVIGSDDLYALPRGPQSPTTHILKPEPKRFHGLVANEFF